MDVFEASSSEQDLRSEYSTLFKNFLMPYKQVIPNIHAFLTWKNQLYPLLIFAYITFVFLTIWLLELSVLTTVSIVGIILTVADLFLPGIISNFCDSSKWNDKDEELFENVCNEIGDCMMKVEKRADSLGKMRHNKSKIYYISLFSALLTLVWVGNTFNNLFLAYMVFLTAALYPGLKHHNILKQGWEKGFALVKSVINKEKKDK